MNAVRSNIYADEALRKDRACVMSIRQINTLLHSFACLTVNYDLEVMSSNPSRVKLGVRSTSKLYLFQNYQCNVILHKSKNAKHLLVENVEKYHVIL